MVNRRKTLVTFTRSIHEGQHGGEVSVSDARCGGTCTLLSDPSFEFRPSNKLLKQGSYNLRRDVLFQ